MEMVAETGQQNQRVAVSPDLYTPEEAAEYLRLPNARSFNRHRREAGVTGIRGGNRKLYAREQLEAIRRHMFALNK